MTRTLRAPAPVTCPNCNRVSERAPHYCPGCGLDYWRVAAGAAATAALPLPGAAPIDTRRSAALVKAGLVGLVAAGIGTAAMVMGSLQPDPPPLIADTLPSRGPEDYVIERFFREARNPYARFSFVSEGTFHQTEPAETEVSMSESVVVYGDDWMSHGTFVSDGETVEESFAVVGGRYFERESADAEWASAEVRGDDRPGSPFFRITTVGEIDYVEGEATNGNTVHQLLVTKWLGGSGQDFRLVGFDRLTERENRYDIWVTDDGVPIRAHGVSTFSVREGGETYTFTTDVTLTFDDWGDVEPIEPPA